MRMRHFQFQFPLFVLALLSTASVNAARAGPESHLTQLSKGYGFVAAKVSDAKPASTRNGFVDSYDVTFRVSEVLAQPILGDELPRHDQLIQVQLSTGYSAQVESDASKALEAGKLFILTIKHAAGDRYDHAYGASAAESVTGITDADRNRFATLRTLALIPEAERTAKWLDVIADSNANEQVRLDLLYSLQWKAVKPTPESKVIVDRLHAIWNDPKIAMSNDFINSLDYSLRWSSRNAFDGTEERARVWMARLLAPTPANRKDDNNRDNLVTGIVSNLIVQQPTIVGPALVSGLTDEQWPAGLKRSMECALVVGYERVASPDPSWEPALQAHFARVLVSKQPWPVRLAASDLVSVQSIVKQQRAFTPNAAVVAALKQSLSDMQALAGNDKQSEAYVATHDIQEALKRFAPRK